MNAELWLTQLQENGYRLTEARRAVVEVIKNPRAHSRPLKSSIQRAKNIARWA